MRSFRVYPNPSGRLYFEVRVYRTKALMHRAIYRHSAWCGSRFTVQSEIDGLCRCMTVMRVWRSGRTHVEPLVGVIFLWQGELGAGVVSHEATHAAIGWAHRVRLSGRAVWSRAVRGPNVSVAEERFAYALSHIANQIAFNLYRLRLLR